MGWKGAILGAWLGGRLLGPLGALIGAVVGYGLGEQAAEGSRPQAKPYTRSRNRSRTRPHTAAAERRERELVFLASAAAMLAKMAKADGVVTRDEIAAVERAFSRLGFTGVVRSRAIEVFRRAKDDRHTIYEYARDFAAAVDAVEVREVFYGLLWDLAGADGVVTDAELAILERVTGALEISPHWYYLYRRERLGAESAGGGRRRQPPPDELADAYRLLNVAPTASDEELRRAYREQAKRYHPDSLRAQGLPDSQLQRATEMMARINAAWERIREARGIR